MTKIQFSIKKWSGWCPGISTKDDWTQWSLGKKPALDDDKLSPNIDFVPPMHRRRLSQLTKMSLKVAFECTQGNKNIGAIFASRYGEWNQSIKLLKSLANKDDISPAGFSLSVHNTAAGIYSISNQNTNSYNSIAANEMTFQAAIVESIGKLRNNDEILLVIGEEAIPDFYKTTFPYNFYPFAFGFVITKENPNLSINFPGKNDNNDTTVIEFMKWYLNENRSSEFETNMFNIQYIG